MAKEYVSLMPRDLAVPRARFLTEENQARYEEACNRFNGEKARDSLRVSQRGSNLFKVLLLNQIGVRTATFPELDLIVQNDRDFLSGTWEDSREVVLRSKGDSYSNNDYLAKRLAKDLKIRGSIKTPLVVSGLVPFEDKNSDYGLVLKPTGETQVIKAPDFSHENDGRKFRAINPDYTVEFDDTSDRTLYTKGGGISRLGLGRGRVADACWDVLADWDAGGRVVEILDAEGVAPQKFKEYLIKLEQEKERQLQELDKRFVDAQKVLKGK